MSAPATVSVVEVMAAVAAQLEQQLGPQLDGIQVGSKLVQNPTPPCVDIYPGEPFIQAVSFGPGGGVEEVYVVRARVTTADHEGGQELLLDLVDPYGPLSVWAALEADASFGGAVSDSTVESVSGFIPYESAGGGAGGYSGSLLGCEWRLRVIV